MQSRGVLRVVQEKQINNTNTMRYAEIVMTAGGIEKKPE